MRVAVLIDGGHLRALSRRWAGAPYTPSLIERTAKASVEQPEVAVRFMYYDCAPFQGTVKLPISGAPHEFKGSDRWLKELAAKDLFAVRYGVLKFRGFKPKRVPLPGQALTDGDFKPDFEQKGVDMRIGLDMANFALM